MGRHTFAALSALTLLLTTASQINADNHTGFLEPGARQDLSARDLERVRKVTQPTTDFSNAEAFETMQGGAGTSTKLVNRDSFSQFLANLTFEQEQEFKLGNALFRKLWVASPSSTQASDGLGPLFNSRSCQSCHLKDGRGHPPLADGDATSMLIRLARPADTEAERRLIADHALLNFVDPVYGGQLQDKAVTGLAAEGRITVAYTENLFAYPDGETVSLRYPAFEIRDLAYGDMHPDTTISPRIAPPMIGLGLVEAIPEADIIANADPDDANADGVSGRIQIVRHPETGEPTLGRFGWKAQNATIRQQSADAFSGDIGISSPDSADPYGDCTQNQTACRALPDGVQARLGDTEAPDPVLDLVTFYSSNLAVPQRRDVDDPQVLEGKELFYAAGCTNCHTPKFVTTRDAPQKEHRFQLIWPYSDFLLHDLGEDMADGQQVGQAGGREWRTPPLWGIGLTETVNGHTYFLHDGRARNLEEAILWHGGEAETARDNFAEMTREQRRALIRFLESL